ncbi:hypothetical protein FACS1894186_6440 [Alphaproteobacteria bacterium]|nr:hypothetical protein FACS1894186_6440 [Alphaproteobacteria bacterium]
MKFDWDENKRSLNLAKHGLDFADAWQVLADPHVVSLIDERRDYGEERLVSIGMVFGIICLSLCHTDGVGAVRVISLRHASRKERRLYHGHS